MQSFQPLKEEKIIKINQESINNEDNMELINEKVSISKKEKKINHLNERKRKRIPVQNVGIIQNLDEKYKIQENESSLGKSILKESETNNISKPKKYYDQEEIKKIIKEKKLSRKASQEEMDQVVPEKPKSKFYDVNEVRDFMRKRLKAREEQHKKNIIDKEKKRIEIKERLEKLREFQKKQLNNSNNNNKEKLNNNNETIISEKNNQKTKGKMPLIQKNNYIDTLFSKNENDIIIINKLNDDNKITTSDTFTYPSDNSNIYSSLDNSEYRNIPTKMIDYSYDELSNNNPNTTNNYLKNTSVINIDNEDYSVESLQSQAKRIQELIKNAEVLAQKIEQHTTKSPKSKVNSTNKSNTYERELLLNNYPNSLKESKSSSSSLSYSQNFIPSKSYSLNISNNSNINVSTSPKQYRKLFSYHESSASKSIPSEIKNISNEDLLLKQPQSPKSTTNKLKEKEPYYQTQNQIHMDIFINNGISVDDTKDKFSKIISTELNGNTWLSENQLYNDLDRSFTNSEHKNNFEYNNDFTNMSNYTSLDDSSHSSDYYHDHLSHHSLSGKLMSEVNYLNSLDETNRHLDEIENDRKSPIAEQEMTTVIQDFVIKQKKHEKDIENAKKFRENQLKSIGIHSFLDDNEKSVIVENSRDNTINNPENTGKSSNKKESIPSLLIQHDQIMEKDAKLISSLDNDFIHNANKSSINKENVYSERKISDSESSIENRSIKINTNKVPNKTHISFSNEQNQTPNGNKNESEIEKDIDFISVKNQDSSNMTISPRYSSPKSIKSEEDLRRISRFLEKEKYPNTQRSRSKSPNPGNHYYESVNLFENENEIEKEKENNVELEKLKIHDLNLTNSSSLQNINDKIEIVKSKLLDNHIGKKEYRLSISKEIADNLLKKRQKAIKWEEKLKREEKEIHEILNKALSIQSKDSVASSASSSYSLNNDNDYLESPYRIKEENKRKYGYVNSPLSNGPLKAEPEEIVSENEIKNVKEQKDSFEDYMEDDGEDDEIIDEDFNDDKYSTYLSQNKYKTEEKIIEKMINSSIKNDNNSTTQGIEEIIDSKIAVASQSSSYELNSYNNDFENNIESNFRSNSLPITNINSNLNSNFIIKRSKSENRKNIYSNILENDLKSNEFSNFIMYDENSLNEEENKLKERIDSLRIQIEKQKVIAKQLFLEKKKQRQLIHKKLLEKESHFREQLERINLIVKKTENELNEIMQGGSVVATPDVSILKDQEDHFTESTEQYSSLESKVDELINMNVKNNTFTQYQHSDSYEIDQDTSESFSKENDSFKKEDIDNYSSSINENLQNESLKSSINENEGIKDIKIKLSVHHDDDQNVKMKVQIGKDQRIKDEISEQKKSIHASISPPVSNKMNEKTDIHSETSIKAVSIEKKEFVPSIKEEINHDYSVPSESETESSKIFIEGNVIDSSKQKDNNAIKSEISIEENIDEFIIAENNQINKEFTQSKNRMAAKSNESNESEKVLSALEMVDVNVDESNKDMRNEEIQSHSADLVEEKIKIEKSPEERIKIEESLKENIKVEESSEESIKIEEFLEESIKVNESLKESIKVEEPHEKSNKAEESNEESSKIEESQEEFIIVEKQQYDESKSQSTKENSEQQDDSQSIKDIREELNENVENVEENIKENIEVKSLKIINLTESSEIMNTKQKLHISESKSKDIGNDSDNGYNDVLIEDQISNLSSKINSLSSNIEENQKIHDDIEKSMREILKNSIEEEIDDNIVIQEKDKSLNELSKKSEDIVESIKSPKSITENEIKNDKSEEIMTENISKKSENENENDKLEEIPIDDISKKSENEIENDKFEEIPTENILEKPENEISVISEEMNTLNSKEKETMNDEDIDKALAILQEASDIIKRDWTKPEEIQKEKEEESEKQEIITDITQQIFNELLTDTMNMVDEITELKNNQQKLLNEELIAQPIDESTDTDLETDIAVNDITDSMMEGLIEEILKDVELKEKLENDLSIKENGILKPEDNTSQRITSKVFEKIDIGTVDRIATSFLEKIPEADYIEPPFISASTLSMFDEYPLDFDERMRIRIIFDMVNEAITDIFKNITYASNPNNWLRVKQSLPPRAIKAQEIRNKVLELLNKWTKNREDYNLEPQPVLELQLKEEEKPFVDYDDRNIQIQNQVTEMIWNDLLEDSVNWLNKIEESKNKN